jgi:3-methylfumaryl-CoA hydratase
MVGPFDIGPWLGRIRPKGQECGLWLADPARAWHRGGENNTAATTGGAGMTDAQTGAVDIDHLRGWIGQEMSAEDVITPRLAAGLAATLNHDCAPALGEVAPAAIHWCLAPPTEPMHALGPDGHPARGGFLPPVPLPRRMWAGGALEFGAPLRVGDRVTMRSRVAEVTAKTGRSGALVFVTVMHEVSGPAGHALTERQDIVYRGEGALAATPAPPDGEPTPTRALIADPVLLFRYSALTFNSHRIHYDQPYATKVEGYAGLVVHGPLQATLMLDLAREKAAGRRLARFTFRGVSPLTEGPVHLHSEPGEARLWVADGSDRTTMVADLVWADQDFSPSDSLP